MAESLYVYALVRSPPGTGLGSGIDGAALRCVEAGGVAAVVHGHVGEPYGGAAEDVARRALEHNAVVERLRALVRAVLPMAFDVLVAPSSTEGAEERLRHWLEEVGPAALARLALVQGRVEMRVDVALVPGAVAAEDAEVAALRRQAATATPGVARLLSMRILRAEREVAERRADELYRTIRERLAARCADIVESTTARAKEDEVLVISASLLVDEDAAGAVAVELESLTAQVPALRTRCYGPWPPYSFAGLGRAGEGRALRAS